VAFALVVAMLSAVAAAQAYAPIVTMVVTMPDGRTQELTATLESRTQQLGQTVEDSLRAAGSAEIASHEVGLAVLEPLKELDEVAYLRFASVYKNFGSVSDFADEIAGLMAASADQELKQATRATQPESK